jgi:polysaccharide biosynthesis transport protein
MMETNFWTYLAVLKRRFWVILLLVAATMAVILGRAWTTPPAYRSSTVLQVIPLEPEEVTLFTRLNTVSPADTIDLILFQFESLVRSPRISQQVVAELGVDASASEIAGGVSVTRDPAGDLITVSATANSPEAAEQILQKQVDLALGNFRESRARPSMASGKFLQTELDAAERELEMARAAVLQFKLDNRVESFDRELAVQEQAIRDLRAARQSAELGIKRSEAAAAELEKQRDAAQQALAAAPADSSAAATGAQRVRDLENQIANERVAIAGRRAEVEGVALLLAEREAGLTALINLGGQHQQLIDALGERQANRDFLAGKVREAQLKESQSRSIGYLQVVSPPSTPRTQVPTRTLQTALLGALLAVVAGAVLVFALEFIEHALRDTPRPAPTARGEKA